MLGKFFKEIEFKHWEKEDKVAGETYLVDSEVVKKDLEDVADEPQEESLNDNN